MTHIGWAGHPAWSPASGVDVEDIRDAWRDACGDLRAAYAAWCDAALENAGDRHAAFLAAVDREAAAAEFLRQRLVTG
jgi:hypothetical protein